LLLRRTTRHLLTTLPLADVWGSALTIANRCSIVNSDAVTGGGKFGGRRGRLRLGRHPRPQPRHAVGLRHLVLPAGEELQDLSQRRDDGEDLDGQLLFE